jgi:uncharacterized integral membrane protein (TIGR00698 family)
LGARLVAPPALDRLRPGFALAARRVLRVAIVLLGLRFSLGYALTVGADALVTITLVVLTGLGTAFLASWLFGIDRTVSLLIGVGTAICGNSAIAAVAPIVGADDEDVSFASVVITGFGMLAMLTLPALGRLLALSAEQFGVLAGAGVHDAAQAIAAGFLYGDEAGGVATLVKLARTAYLVPLVIVLSVVMHRRDPERRGNVAAAVPLFALGFLGAAMVRSAGDRLLGDGTGWWMAGLGVADTLAAFLLAVAMAAIGAQTRLAALRRVGRPALLAGLVAATACATVAAVGAITLT